MMESSKRYCKYKYWLGYVLRKIAGLLFLVGASQFIVCMIMAEALYPNYSTANNFISDLGVGPSAILFNSSIIVFGLMVLGGSYCMWRVYRSKVLTILLLLAGIGATGVGIFTENAGSIHRVVSLIAFLFGGLSAIYAYKVEKFPLNYVSVVMGLAGLIALVLFVTENFLELGNGGMERMIAYPIVLWAIGFGGYLIGLEDKNP
jgi:hypothetical membrane protein